MQKDTKTIIRKNKNAKKVARRRKRRKVMVWYLTPSLPYPFPLLPPLPKTQ